MSIIVFIQKYLKFLETCKKFTLRYEKTGECVAVNAQTNLFLSNSCDTLFTIDDDGKIMDFKGKR